MYNSDLSCNPGYLGRDEYDSSYKHLGHVQKAPSMNMKTMLYRKQFKNKEYHLPNSSEDDAADETHSRKARTANHSSSAKRGESGYIKIGDTNVRKNFSNLLMENGYIRKPSDVDFGGLPSKRTKRDKNWNRLVIKKLDMDSLNL